MVSLLLRQKLAYTLRSYAADALQPERLSLISGTETIRKVTLISGGVSSPAYQNDESRDACVERLIPRSEFPEYNNIFLSYRDETFCDIPGSLTIRQHIFEFPRYFDFYLMIDIPQNAYFLRIIQMADKELSLHRKCFRCFDGTFPIKRAGFRYLKNLEIMLSASFPRT